jgi:predicted glycogen debranching enzyme
MARHADHTNGPKTMPRDADASGPRRDLEFLETNGLGGFASSTVVGMNTRRYHGLLVAALKPPVERFVLLSKIEETMVIDGVRFELTVNQYPGVIHPTGDQYLVDFRLDPFPVFRYRAGGVEIEKRLFLVHGENTVVVQYAQLSGAPCQLDLRPLMAFRDYHSTTHRNGAWNASVDQLPGLASVQPYADLPRLHLAHNAQEVAATGDWYLNFEYQRERERGLDCHEDLFQPFVLRYALQTGATAAVIASTEPSTVSILNAAEQAAQWTLAETDRRNALRAAAPLHTRLVEALTLAADQFLVQRGALKTVIAGYPWFSDWGRDTMIALPGLTLATGRYAVARDILRAFAQSVDQGMLPNRFPDAGELPEYNTVDATLWFFEAVRAYAEASSDDAFVQQELLPVLRDIVDWHERGTRYGIRMDPADGLLACGEPGVQLTWMDGKVGDWVVTPRAGKPVEIQALWYNALRIMEALTGEPKYGAMALRAQANFQRQFWNAEADCLYDVVDGATRDASVRPNQIFAVSLHYPILEGDRARQVVDVVERELLTPAGLRTLSPQDPQYKGRYEGGVWQRDSAYHQGTVWPWLAGPFFFAYLKTHPEPRAARLRAASWLEEFEVYLHNYCLGQFCEIADGDAPHMPRGCVAQAWSVAEMLRLAIALAS